MSDVWINNPSSLLVVISRQVKFSVTDVYGGYTREQKTRQTRYRDMDLTEEI